MRVLSTAIATLALFASMANAHEVMPAIADMERDGDRLTFSIAANVESFVAGIDLEGLEDTGAADNGEIYDALRALDPEAMAQRFESYWPQMAEKITVRAGDTPLQLTLTGVEVTEAPDVEVARQSVFRFEAALPGGASEVSVGWTADLGALVLRQQGVEDPYSGYLDGGALSPPIVLGGGNSLGPWATFAAYIPVGVDHIVPLGLDHILFVLGLFFLAPSLGPLLWQVSAFTLAHTISLALAALDLVSVPASIVEPLIAASIVYVAVENIFRSGKLSPWRPAVIFCFGLLHGLGFASVLAEFGLPEGAFVPALIGFNIGVELGQLAVIAVAFLITFAAQRSSRTGHSDKTAGIVYLVLAMVLVPLLAIPLSGLDGETFGALMPLLAAGAILLGFSASAAVAEGQGTYGRMVAQPASILIALTGAWWVVERVFL